MIWQACVKKSRRKRFVSWIRFLNKQFEEIKLSECKWYLETLRTHGFWASHDKISVLCVEGSFKHDAHDVLILPTCTRETGQTDYSFMRMKFTLFIQYFRNSFVTATEIFMEYFCYYYCYTNKSFFFLSTRGLPNQTYKVISMFDLSDFYAGYSSWHNPRGICVSFQHQNRDLMFVRQLLPLIITMIMF